MILFVCGCSSINLNEASPKQFEQLYDLSQNDSRTKFVLNANFIGRTKENAYIETNNAGFFRPYKCIYWIPIDKIPNKTLEQIEKR